MYESTYGFREKPFALQPDPDFLYLSANHRTALSFLEYGILNQAGFSVITGEVGAGKTTLLRKILQETDQAVTVGFIAAPHMAFGHLLQWVLMSFRLDAAGKDTFGMFQEFTKFLLAEGERNRRVILVVDEAQNLDVPMLEQLRLLSNINVGKKQILQVVLSGQPGLRDLLHREELVQFAQRVLVDHHLGPMNEHDTRAYIEHRLRVAGGSPSLFTDEACGLVYRATGGIPRLVNQICEMALVYGFAERANRITLDIVAEACKDKRQGGVVPLRPNGAGTVAMGAAGDAEQATALPRRVNTTAHESAATLLQRGQSLQAQGRYDEAIVLLERASQDSSHWVKAFGSIGACHRAAGRTMMAILSLRKALADQSAPLHEIIPVRYELAVLLEAAGKKEDALDCYRRVCQVDPDFRDSAERIGRLSGARRSGRPTWIMRARRRFQQWAGSGNAS